MKVNLSHLSTLKTTRLKINTTHSTDLTHGIKSNIKMHLPVIAKAHTSVRSTQKPMVLSNARNLVSQRTSQSQIHWYHFERCSDDNLLTLTADTRWKIPCVYVSLSQRAQIHSCLQKGPAYQLASQDFHHKEKNYNTVAVLDWTKAVRPFRLPKWDSLWQSDKNEMERKILQYGWLLSRTDELLMRKSSLGLSSYTHAWRRSNRANEQKERLLNQERVRTARSPYRHESLSELMMIQLYHAFTPVVSIWKNWILSKTAPSMVFIALALSFWICLLYFWVIISCIHYVFAGSPISRKRWFLHAV